jgi:tetratricopeptide (TPR) repeat protein
VAGQLATIEGQVTFQSVGASDWQPANLNQSLCKGDTVRAGERSRATVVLVNQAVLRIDQNTAMRLDNISGVAEEKSFLSLLKGTMQSFSRKPRSFEVSTPYLNGSIEGTEFVFKAADGESVLTVFEGTVKASNAQGSASVSGGESVASLAGQAPQARTVVNPRDAAQWSLYYPPLLATGAGGAQASAALQQAASDLSVGRVDEARAGVEQAIAGQGADAGLAYALRAVINVVQNQRELALSDARQAVALSPDSAAAKIALSYARQANFQLNEARDSLLLAVSQQPGNALAHARLAELQLMLGEKAQASASAQQAVSLAPELGRSQITLGFAALAEFRNSDAEAAFTRAIELDSADPLPHLGLGLARISEGDLQAGRSEIELAVGLDSNSALLRAYLGKAYFEEMRPPLDSQQFGIASQLDPMDPTPWLYEGIALQTRNQPVAAAAALDKSIELNDNRATYRSRLLLDKDRAARGTSLARVYKDLGFSRLGVNEATQSLSADFANASAHRFLSDTYKDTSGRLETSRVSELLQSQLLQDVNLNPVQPSLSSTNLNIVTAGGPADAGFNEFTPLFERNQGQFSITGFGGNNDTSGGEAVLSGVKDALSGSAGYFKYNSDGYRKNNDLDHSIQNVFGQWAVSDALNVQAEYRHRDTEFGDLRQNFDLDSFDSTFRRETDEDVYRLGARIATSQQSKILLSYIKSNIDSSRHSVPLDIVVPSIDPILFPDGYIRTTEDSSTSQDTDQYDIQHIFSHSSFHVVSGASYSNSDASELITSVTSYEFPPFVPDTTDPPVLIDTGSSAEDKRLYVYGDWNITPAVTATAGLSYVNFESDISSFDKNDFNEFNPKLGVSWRIQQGLTARAAYFRNVMPVMASKRTLEPTEVAGFNQFYDDPSTTKSKRYGVALDWQPVSSLTFGTELTRRMVESPVLDVSSGTIPFETSHEWDYRGYTYWTPSERWALGLDVLYDRFRNQPGSLVASSVPRRVSTWTLPAKVAYFHPSGWFGGIGVTYIDQEVRREQPSSMAEGDSSFALADAFTGYRLPKRRGVISLTVQNLFNRDFRYQDESYRTFSLEPYVSSYVPELTLMGKVTLSF